MTEQIRIAIIDDELDMRQSISQWLSLSGFETRPFASAREALAEIEPGWPGIVMTDIRMPEMDGMTLLKRLMHLDSGLPVIMITGHGDVPMAVEAMRIGAADFLEKPFDPERMTEIVRKSVDARRVTLEHRALRNELSSGTDAASRLIGTSQLMERLRKDIINIGQAEGHVLIEGETGTGKTLVARAIHAVGAHANRPLVQVHFGSLDEAQQIDTLFGFGTESGALQSARGGTLLLEDIGRLHEGVQARLLSWLEETPETEVPRILSVCNRQADETRAENALRPNLFHRLSALRVSLPPLRNRGDDILMLFNDFMRIAAEEYGSEAPQISAQEAAQLLQAPWPGNVRQLMNVAERAVLQHRRDSGSITSLLISDNEALPQSMMEEGKPLKEYVESFERMLIDNTMRRHRGSVAKVMEELCLPRRTLNEKMAKYGLVRGDYL
ncbi:MAG: sigma-54-dependent transcriptional regulator [Qingshengfaniella sp.]